MTIDDLKKLPPMTLIPSRSTAEVLGLSQPALNNLRMRGSGPRYCRLSPRKIRYFAADVVQYVEDRLAEPGRVG
jgi:predicted DNA-binding transcriptional regulator AlpA